MAERNDDKILEHSYDGIQEFDNPMPRWWLWVFYATIVFVPIYYFAPAPFGEGAGWVAEYDADVARQLAAQPAETGGAGLDDAQLMALATQPAATAEGKQLFATNCSACHRADGGGLIGPNLTDDAWIHGGTPTAIHKSIVDGVLAKGMPPWGKMLKPSQVDAVTAYVISLAGTNPPSPKAPEGAVGASPAGN